MLSKDLGKQDIEMGKFSQNEIEERRNRNWKTTSCLILKFSKDWGKLRKEEKEIGEEGNKFPFLNVVQRFGERRNKKDIEL